MGTAANTPTSALRGLIFNCLFERLIFHLLAACLSLRVTPGPAIDSLPMTRAFLPTKQTPAGAG